MAQLYPEWAEYVRMNEKIYRLIKKAKNAFLDKLKFTRRARRGESRILDETEAKNGQQIFSSNFH